MPMDLVLALELLLAAGIFVLMVAYVVIQIRIITWLRRCGRPVAAYVTCSVRGKTRLTSGTCFITAAWTDPRTLRTYTFHGVSSQPTCREGDLVTVRVDPKHPRRYLLEA